MKNKNWKEIPLKKTISNHRILSGKLTQVHIEDHGECLIFHGNSPFKEPHKNDVFIELPNENK